MSTITSTRLLTSEKRYAAVRAIKGGVELLGSARFQDLNILKKKGVKW